MKHEDEITQITTDLINDMSKPMEAFFASDQDDYGRAAEIMIAAVQSLAATGICALATVAQLPIQEAYEQFTENLNEQVAIMWLRQNG